MGLEILPWLRSLDQEKQNEELRRKQARPLVPPDRYGKTKFVQIKGTSLSPITSNNRAQDEFDLQAQIALTLVTDAESAEFAGQVPASSDPRCKETVKALPFRKLSVEQRMRVAEAYVNEIILPWTKKNWEFFQEGRKSK